MALKPEVSISVGLATAALVYSVYSNATPSITEIRAAKPNDSDVEASRKLAAWTSAGVVAAVSLISKDPTVFILGGAMVVAVDWWHRHANAVNPMVGKATAMMNRDGNLPVETQENSEASFGYSDDVSVY